MTLLEIEKLFAHNGMQSLQTNVVLLALYDYYAEAPEVKTTGTKKQIARSKERYNDWFANKQSAIYFLDNVCEDVYGINAEWAKRIFEKKFMK